MDKLSAYRAFLCVVEQRGFTAAARQLGLSPSAVSKMIAWIETEFGAQLLKRSTRQTEPTDVGVAFYERCVQFLAELETSEAVLRDAGKTEPFGVLRVALPYSFGRVTVLPHLHRFLARYPKIDLEIAFDDNIASLVGRTSLAGAQSFDIAVGKGAVDDSHLATRVLTRGPLLTVASPAYLERKGAPLVPADIAAHECLRGRDVRAWRYTMDGAEIRVPIRSRLTLLSGDHMLEAAMGGLGLAQGTQWLFRHALTAGKLNTVLDDYAVEGDEMRVIYTRHRYTPLKLRVFLDFLVEITRSLSGPPS